MDVIKIFFKKNLITIFFLGLTSGIPLMLTLSTLTAWLSRLDMTRTTIGLFAIVGIPYTIKFLWSFIFDYVNIPYLTKIFGIRLSWLLILHILLGISIVILGHTDPQKNLYLTALSALLVSFMSASLDVVIDAYRIESLEDREQASGAAMNTYGYRIGMLISGSGALVLSDLYSWDIVYSIMALFMMIGIIAILFNGEPNFNRNSSNNISIKSVMISFIDFTKRKKSYWILLFITLYKLPDALLANLANKFYIEMGFTNTQIGLVGKTFGFAMTMLGSFLGAYLAMKIGNFRALFISLVLQSVSNLAYIILIHNQADIFSLYVVIAIENISSSLGIVVIVAYLSNLCNLNYTATQYAVLSSFTAFGRTIFAMWSGFIVDDVGWTKFFIVTSLSGIPSIIILKYIIKDSFTKKFSINKNYGI